MKVTRDYLRKVIQETLELEASKKPSPKTLSTVERYKSKVQSALNGAISEVSEAIYVLGSVGYRNDKIESHVEELNQIKQKIESLYKEIYGSAKQSKSTGPVANDSRGSNFWDGSGGPNDR